MITVDTEGKLLRWYDDVGAMVEQGDVIAELQTEAGPVPVIASQAGRLTEMLALADDNVHAGQTIGWIDAVDAPQQLGALIDPPAPERKLKPREFKRKPRPVFRMNQALWVGLGLAAVMAASVVTVLLFAPFREVEVWGKTVIVTVTPDHLLMPMPTPAFRIRERVLLNAQVGEHYWGEQGIVQNSGFEMGSGTWYEVQFGDDMLRLSESQLQDLSSIAPTPTMRFDGVGRDWSSIPMVLKEPVADFPAGTRVYLGSAMFNGVEYELNVVTENGVSLTVREAQLEIPSGIPANPSTPSVPMWSNYTGVDVYAMMTNQYVGDIPPNTRVRLSSLRFGDGEWIYTIMAEGSPTETEARESQLSPAT